MDEDFYMEIPCEIEGDVIKVPSVEVPSAYECDHDKWSTCEKCVAGYYDFVVSE